MEDSDLKITDLNDDCLTQIVNFLPLTDLFQLFKAIKSFWSAIANVLPKQIVKLTPKSYSMKDGLFFQTFGCNIKKLKFLRLTQNQMDKFINDYCAGGGIAEIVIIDGYRSKMTLCEQFIEKNSQFFKPLKSLSLEFVKIKSKGIVAILNKATELTALTIDFCSAITDPPNYLVITKRDIQKLSVQKMVKKLSLLDITFPIEILQKFPNVEELVLAPKTPIRLLTMPFLNSLQTLDVHFFKTEDSGMELLISTVAQHSNIHLLQINPKWLSVRSIVENICTMKSLQILILRATTVDIGYNCFKQFGDYLIELRSIYFNVRTIYAFNL